MAQSTSRALRALWMQVHLWIGIGLLVAIVPISLTGAILVWHEPMERAMNKDRFAVSEAPASLAPSGYLAAAAAAFEGRAVPATVRLPAEPGVPVTVVGTMSGPPQANGRPRQLTAWLDPATARVTDVAEISRSVFSVMHRLHGSLLIPQVGRKIVGWIGWAMTLSCVTGLWLWWPRNGKLALGLRWKRTPATMDNLHHVIGFWICIPLAILSLTGVYISFPQTSRALFGVESPAAAGPARGPRPPAPKPLEQTALDIDQAAAAALTAAPAAKLLVINAPTEGREPAWRIQVQDLQGKTQNLQVSEATGEARPDRGGAGARPAPDPLSRWMRRVHDGVGMGLVWQTVVVLGGVAPVILALTGLVMWLRRQIRKARLRQPIPQPAE